MKQKALSGLEQQVMNIVWESKQCSVRDVLLELTKKREIAYPTVATILRRLEEKHFIRKNTKEMTFFYIPKITKEQYGKGLASSFIKKFMQSLGNVAMSSFLHGLDELPKERREDLLRLLDKHDKNK